MQPTEATYEIVSGGGKFIAIVLPFREGRLPIVKTTINSAACVIITGQDGKSEVLGTPNSPVPANIIELLRTHHEGMLLTELFDSDDPRAKAFAAGLPPVAGEQMLKAPLTLT